ncbi:gamma-tubulin complex component 2-like isoform X1 [Schistocerca cancellata]|uniref:gamma-tubulin complex component 2-like isoform X1 n=1 Tax=Schistocerca cancellata TaxID=274614 RepID=UPI0021180A7D|nr:gamma-tubulin complex component 2-like isoform X1 [Schistocerca cancellata]
MSEFKVHRLMKDLVTLTRSPELPEVLIERLQQTESRHVNPGQTAAVQTSLRQLCRDNPTEELFTAKYNELKTKNADCLVPYVQLLSLISDDKDVKEYLERRLRRAQERSRRHGSSNTNVSATVTTDDLPQIRNRLMKELVRGSNEGKAAAKAQSDAQAKVRHPTYHVPVMIDCKAKRPNMNMDFVTDTGPSSLVGALGVIPAVSQESILIQDILCVLQGLEGVCIKPDKLESPYATRTFGITPSVDSSLSQLAKKFFPLASHYSIIARFIEEKRQFECGQVNHALVAAVDSLIKEYLVSISQLEAYNHRGSLNLQELWFYIQHWQRTLEVLADIATFICRSDAKGGKVLTLLHELTSSFNGDIRRQEMCLHLTQSACGPYIEILEKWIYKGVISDPYREFLVEDNEVIQKEELPLDYSADYWEKRYTVRRERIPAFLENISDVILRTGKYLNVIRQCGKSIKSPQAEEIKYTIKERKYVEVIERAYLFASKTLLQLLMEENDLMGRLRSVKHYFLLDQGDFIAQFMEVCEQELSKNIDDIVPTRLESLLELVLRTSTANVDPYKDDMRTELLPYDLISQMFKILSIETDEEKEYRVALHNVHLSGIEAFSFGYDVKWPVSLVLNRKAIACYQMLFRHLFYCKHIEKLLCRVWKKNKMAKLFSNKALIMYTPAFALRMRMLDYVQNLEYYMMVEVIEPNWVNFLSNISKVNNVDEVLVCHSDFLDICLKDCMLTNPKLLRTVYKLLDVCMSFHDFMENMGRYYMEAELTSMIGSDGSSDSLCESLDIPTNDSTVGESESFEQNVAKFNLKFTSLFSGLLDGIRELPRDNNNEKLINLMYRLDFNGSYSDQLNIFGLSNSSHKLKEGETSG